MTLVRESLWTGRALAMTVGALALVAPDRPRATESAELLERVEAVVDGKGEQLEEARRQRTRFHFAIEVAASRNGISPSLLWAVIRVESNFDPDAVSPVGAQGLGQLMPGTAEELGVSDPFDPRQNLDAAAAYLAALIERMGGVRPALAAYHTGPSRARDALRNRESSTYRYVRRVLAHQREYRARENP